MINGLKTDMDKKVSYDDLWKSQALILDKLDEVTAMLLKKLADKGETKRALIFL